MAETKKTEDPRDINDLYRAFESADFVVRKRYRDSLEDYPICDLPNRIKRLVPDEVSETAQISCILGDNAQFFRIEKLVYDKNENITDKLTTVYHSMTAFKNTSILMLIKSDGSTVELYMGVAERFNGETINITERGNKLATLKTTFESNFPGSTVSEVINNRPIDKVGLIKSTFADVQSISCVTGIASLRNENEKENSKFIQGLEKLIDAMRGKEFAALFIADCKGLDEIEDLCSNYEDVYSKLYPFTQSQQTIGRTDGVADTQSFINGVVDTTNESVANTVSHSHTLGKSTSDTFGGSVSAVCFTGSYSRTTGKNEADSDQKGQTTTTGSAKSLTSQNSVAKAISVTTNDGLQITFENRAVKTLLDRIDEQIKHLRACEAYGVFDFGCYFIAKEQAVSSAAASIYDSLMRGEQSSTEVSAVNTWTGDTASKVAEYLKRFYHPLIAIPDLARPVALDEEEKQDDSQLFSILPVTPTSIVSGKGLALQMGLPKKAVCGVPVTECAEFGRNVISSDEEQTTDIRLGSIYHMQKDEKTAVELDAKSLTMHTFITGSTGSGKSNTIYQLLNQLHENGATFLVIEPAKGEYKNVFGKRACNENSNPAGEKQMVQIGAYAEVYGTNPNLTKLLRINPFSFPEEIHIYEHMDRLVEIFNACWPMYAAMPAVLKDAIERAYQDAGWNLRTSENRYDNRLFPTFTDVLRQIDIVMEESQYSSDSKGDYKGALSTRLRSLTNGINGMIFSADEIAPEKLFDENVIVDISRVGSSETKSLIMGLLIMKLQEHRMSKHTGMNEDLKHVTVLEEAHTLLKRTSTEQSGESANLVGKSVEMLTNAIAEMRTYGEGFIIADQSPGLLDMAVIRNTNTKIILRLPEYSDRQLVGKAAGLNDDQIEELARLKKGVAAVYQNDWIEAVLCKIDRFTYDEKFSFKERQQGSFEGNNFKEKILRKINVRDLYHLIDPIDKESIIKAVISAKAKCRLFDYMEVPENERHIFAAAVAYDLLGCDKMITQMKPEIDIEEQKRYLSYQIKNDLPRFFDEPIDIDFILYLVVYWFARETDKIEAKELADRIFDEGRLGRIVQ